MRLNVIASKAQNENKPKNFVGFLVDSKKPKGHFEIKWPLDSKYLPNEASKAQNENKPRNFFEFKICSKVDKHLKKRNDI